MIEMTNEEYHAHHAISSSDVKMVHGKSLAHTGRAHGGICAC
jgi:hypothetical protein